MTVPTWQAAPSAVLYYGLDEPSVRCTSAVRDTDVVLQPYHPVVRDGRFEEVFPHCRRYVYWNPTAADPWVVSAEGEDVPLLGRDEQWGIDRLDLEWPAAQEFAVRQAIRALQQAGVTGLFVDDLDRLAGRQQHVARHLVAEVEARAGRHVSWFVNRGFFAWPWLHRLDAALLEELAPADIAAMPADRQDWVVTEVLPALITIAPSSTRIVALTYQDDVSRHSEVWPSAAIATYVDEVIVGSRSLDAWPKGWQS